MKKSDMKKLIVIGTAMVAATAATAVIISRYKKSQEQKEKEWLALKNKHAYITGGGLSALASALYLVRDCGFTPSHVHVYTNYSRTNGNEETGYICRRGKIIDEKKCMNLFDLLSGVRSVDIPDLTVCDEILNIYSSSPAMRNITFIDNSDNVVDISRIRLEKQHRNMILKLMREKKETLMNMPIHEAFPNDFLTSYFYKLLCATYGFCAESNAYEFVNAISHMDDMLSGTLPSDFDRYEEIIEPLTAHIRSMGVDLRDKAVVTDIDFENGNADSIHFTDNGIRKTIYLNDGDICIFPTDEMAECETFGSFNDSAPRTFSEPFELWNKLSQKHPAFKNPSVIFDDLDAHRSEEFTITLSNRMLPELIDKVTCGALGHDGVIVLDNSAWKMTICAVPPSHFKNQSDDIAILWGTAVRFDRNGDYCPKPMTDCSGAEILYELVSCFNLGEAWEDIRETVINVIPCHRQYDKAILAPVASKLEIIPTGISNLAISGDFADSDDGSVFSEEYPVITARKAAYTLMRKRSKIYQSKPSSSRSIKKMLRHLV